MICLFLLLNIIKLIQNLKSNRVMKVKETILKRESSKNSQASPTEATSSSPRWKEMYTSISPKKNNRQNNNQLQSLENRYRKLEDNYYQVLEKIHQRSVLYQKQKQQIQIYKFMHKKHQKEIHILRGMLGFLPKEDKQVQVNFDEFQEKRSVERQTKWDITSSFYRQKKTNLLQSTKHSSFSKLGSSKLSQASYQQIDNVTSQPLLHRKISNSPYSKYKFVSKINIK